MLQYRAYLSTNGLHVKGELLHPKRMETVGKLLSEDDGWRLIHLSAPCLSLRYSSRIKEIG